MTCLLGSIESFRVIDLAIDAPPDDDA